jgi:hypothetical protein
MESARMSVKLEPVIGSDFEPPRRVENYGEDSESDKQLIPSQEVHSRTTAPANSIRGMLDRYDESDYG